jgi:hypothetical protein
MTFFPVPETIQSQLPAGARDFDFLQGEWIIQHRRLRQRLVGSDEWDEFETPAIMHVLLGGLGNVDQCRTSTGDFFEGVSLRLFDKADGLWRIYWTDSSGARLFPPLIGSFTGPIGIFRGNDQHGNISVKVTFRWDKTDPNTPIWQQAFSADDGQTWETNWIMHFRRPDPSPE